MKRTEKTISVILLFIISLSNVATPVTYAAQTVASETPSSDMIAPTTPIAPPKFKKPDSGSVLGASTSLFAIGTGGTDTQQSASKRIPIRVRQLAKKVYQTDEDVTVSVVNPDNDPFATSVVDSSGKNANVPITESNDGTTTTVQIAGSNEITPGEYKVNITDDQGNVTTQDFNWGVLALNTDKSMYHPGDAADISMAVLDNNGSMVCDANLQLQITNQAAGVSDLLSTNATSPSAQITINPQCQKHDFSLQPDYEVQYTFAKAGTYNLQLTAQTQAGTHTISSTIPVTNQIPFDVQRMSATRVYPPNTYPMTFNITAHQDFSGTVTETVPEDFTITPATGSAQTNSYSNMQTMYLNSNDPAAQLQQAINASSSGGLVMPFHGDYPITQGFGAQMTDPTLQAFYTQYGLAGHDGVDFGVPMNTSLYAVDDGTVTWSGPGDYGITIIIQHTWGESYYGHLSTTAVKVGDAVSKGELIGYSGESGEATGPHLHFGMKPLHPDMQNGYYGKVDPLSYLPYNQQQPQDLSTLNPTLAAANSPTVLSASTSADTDASDSAGNTISPTPLSGITGIQASPTPTATQSAVVSSAPVVPSPTTTPTTSTTESQTPVNTAITVLEKKIFLNEQLTNSSQTEKVKVISWNVTLKKGETTSLGYDYKVPTVSPQFYLLGPMQFYAQGSSKVVFQEQRQWQIASDDVGVEWYSNTTGNKWNGYSWRYRKKLDISLNNVYATPSAQTIDFMDSGGDATQDITTANGGFFTSTTTSGGSTVAVDSTTSETGPDSIRFTTNTSGVEAAATKTGILANAGRRISGYFKFSAFSSAGRTNIISIDNSGDSQDILNVDVSNVGLLSLRSDDPGGTQLATGATLSLNTWYRISVAYTITSNTSYSAKVYLNGVLTMSASNSPSLNSTTVTTADLCVGICGDTSDTTAYSINMDDLYVDSGSDLSDTGDVHVTAKRPNANGAANGFGTQIGAGGSGYGTGHSPQVNERPLSTTNGWQTASNATTEEYTIENAQTGDVNIPTNAGLIGDQAWIYTISTAVCTTGSADIINNGVSTAITLPTAANTMLTNYASMTTYPSTNLNKAVGISTCTTGAPTIKLFEAGVQFAYIPDLTNFPVLVNLSSDNDLKNNAQSGGNDVLFTDSTGENLLPFEIEKYNNSTGSLQAWVNISSLSTANDTIIYMYYGNPSTASKSNSSGTWNGNYGGVWHLGATSGTTASDSTSNGNTGTLSGSLTLPSFTSGEIGNAVNFPSGDTQAPLITAGSGSSLTNLNATGMTIAAWINPSGNSSNDAAIASKADGSDLVTGWYFYYDGCSSCLNLGFGAAFNTGFLSRETTSNVNILTLNTWQYVIVTWDGSGTATNVHFYVNGVETTYAAGATNGSAGYTGDTGDIFTIANTSDGFEQAYQGLIDEVEVSNIIRSPGWITTQYKNQSNPGPGVGDFVSILGGAETSIYAPTLSQLMRHGEWFSAEGQVQPFSF